MILKKWYAATALALSILAVSAPSVWYASLPRCETRTPSLQSDERFLTCAGSVINSEISCVSLSVPVYVSKTYVSNGSSVTKGQKLFDVDRKKMLALAVSGTDDTFDFLSEEDYMSALSVLAGASEDKSVALDTLPAAVYATDDGTVCDFNAATGSILAADSAICTISKGDRFQLRLTVPEDQLGRFAVDGKVCFSPVAYPDREYYGTVNDRAAIVRRQLTTSGYKNVADIFVTVETSDEYLSEGMSITATVSLPKTTTLLTVPYSAVLQDDEGEYVYKQVNGRAVRQTITTGAELEKTVEVTSGLTLQDDVLQNGAEIKREGQLIRN